MSADVIIPPKLGCELCTRYDYVSGHGWCKEPRDGIIYCSIIPFRMRKYGCSNHSLRKNHFIVKEIADHVDARMDGLQNLMNTPPEQRTESAQDDKLKQAYFELSLVKNLIKDLIGGNYDISL